MSLKQTGQEKAGLEFADWSIDWRVTFTLYDLVWPSDCGQFDHHNNTVYVLVANKEYRSP